MRSVLDLGLNSESQIRDKETSKKIEDDKFWDGLRKTVQERNERFKKKSEAESIPKTRKNREDNRRYDLVGERA